VNRKLRQGIDLVLTGGGILIIIGSVMADDSVTLQVQIGWVVLGILLIEAGVGGFTNQFVGNERRYGRLREAGDRTMELVRELNSAAVAHYQGREDDSRFQKTLEAMHAKVREMAELAAIEDGAEEPGRRDTTSTA